MRLKSTVLGCLLMILVCTGTAAAQDFETSVVTGNTYTCYFLSRLDIFNTDIFFDEKGGMAFAKFEGNGFYFTLANLFVGIYWSLNAKIGTRTGDSVFVLTGSTIDPFVIGTGTLLFEYSDLYGLLYFGFRNVEEE